MSPARSLRLALLLVLLTGSTLPLAACGKKGPPTLPPGQTDQFPRQMPAPNSDLPPDQQQPSPSQPSQSQP
jgi:predicted small lipoprotein YifL